MNNLISHIKKYITVNHLKEEMILSKTNVLSPAKKDIIAEHPNSLATAYILRMSKTDLEIPFVQSVYNNFDDDIKNSSIGKSLKKQIKAKEKTALGNSFIDIRMKDANGKEVSVSELAKKTRIILNQPGHRQE
jgi:hypothetical protein